jgi:circadian clock protein KaiB
MSSELEGHADPVEPSPEPTSDWSLRLYVLGHSPQSEAAIRNLRRLCENHLSGHYRIEIVDLLVTPRLSRDDQIVAIPTLIRKLPAPIRKIIGDLSDTERTLVGLELRPAARTRRLPT